jgi:hydroxymethylpyrimidine pyrophosphatase-like HAD family hydrolase
MEGRLTGFSLNRDGTQNVTVTVASNFADQYDRLKDFPVSVEIRKATKKRSKDANAMCWAMCSDIGNALRPPLPKEEVYRKAIREVGEFSSAHGHPKNFELQADGVSKGSALLWLCGHLGIRPSDAVAFGDEANDVSLLAAAGDGVAMANAIPQARAVANHTAPSNDDAGVASYVMALLGGADHK